MRISARKNYPTSITHEVTIQSPLIAHWPPSSASALVDNQIALTTDGWTDVSGGEKFEY